MNYNIDHLFAEYTSARQLRISAEQFIPLVVFYPSLSVVSSDGVVDNEERSYINSLNKFLSKNYSGQSTHAKEILSLKDIYEREAEFLLEHRKDWDEKFLTALTEYLQTNPDVRATVMETMHLFAEASDGTSPVERIEIDRVSKALGA